MHLRGSDWESFNILYSLICKPFYLFSLIFIFLFLIKVFDPFLGLSTFLVKRPIEFLLIIVFFFRLIFFLRCKHVSKMSLSCFVYDIKQSIRFWNWPCLTEHFFLLSDLPRNRKRKRQIYFFKIARYILMMLGFILTEDPIWELFPLLYRNKWKKFVTGKP